MWPLDSRFAGGAGGAYEGAVLAAAAGGVVVYAAISWWSGAGERRPSSYPGGPRAGRCTYRSPAWPPGRKSWQVPTGWKLSVGEASHALTEAMGGVSLTGEAAGRQIWWFDEAAAAAASAAAETPPGIDATGGGARPFDPASNPNAEDRIMREAQVAKWSQNRQSQQQQSQRIDGGEGAGDEDPVERAMRRGVEYYEQLQCEDGHFAGDYGGPLFLMPGLIIVAYVTGSMEQVLPPRHREAMIIYLRNHQQADGGWGTHIEGASTMFGTSLCYVSLRLLGVPATDDAAVQGRHFLHAHGGALYTSSWAKFWLSVLGVYSWEGLNPIPVEMWLLPLCSPFHPWRMWCHARMVYLPMGYLYCSRFVYPGATCAEAEGGDPLIRQLRRELYPPVGSAGRRRLLLHCSPPTLSPRSSARARASPGATAAGGGGEDGDDDGSDYSQIAWDSARHSVAEIDDYSPVSVVMRRGQDLLAAYERSGLWRSCRPLAWLRQRGLGYARRYMVAEDEQTNYLDIGPVNKAMNMLCAYDHALRLSGGDPARARASEAFTAHVARVGDYLWVSEDGMKMQGYNGSQVWDTAFAVQAFLASGLRTSSARGASDSGNGGGGGGGGGSSNGDGNGDGEVAAAPPPPPSPVIARAWGFLERSQILSTAESQATAAYAYEEASMRQLYHRHVSQGGWPFSTSAHGWPISDCTAEGLKAALLLREQLFRPPLTAAAAAAAEDATEQGQAAAVQGLGVDLAAVGAAAGDRDSRLLLRPIADERLFDAVNVLLTLHNPRTASTCAAAAAAAVFGGRRLGGRGDGGWATYENTRGWRWYEALNPSEVFGDIMIDYEYVECTAACISALSLFRTHFPAHRTAEVTGAIEQGRRYLRSMQRDDGSWYGSWGCCFTYGVWFGVHGLIDAGEEPHSSPAIAKARTFLLAHQNPNGGWGEDFSSCYDRDYAAHGAERYGTGGSSVVQTSWAVLALCEAASSSSSQGGGGGGSGGGGEEEEEEKEEEERVDAALRRGVEWLVASQRGDGDWAQQGIAGVFNRSCGISYTQYRNIFPIWALAKYCQRQRQSRRRRRAVTAGGGVGGP